VSVHFDAPFKVGVNAGEDFDERAFARAVLARQYVDFSAPNYKLRILQNRHFTKPLRDAGHANQRRF
jgi:hypothetical protein